MKREMNYLEEFLFSAQTKIDSLNVTTEPENIDEYKYLVVSFEQNAYKIPYDLVFNFCNSLVTNTLPLLSIIFPILYSKIMT